MLDFKFEEKLIKFIRENYQHNFYIVVKSNYGIIEIEELEDELYEANND